MKSKAVLKKTTCPLCKREGKLTFHHLIPKKMHRRMYFKRHFSKAQLNLGIDICRLCHDGIHDLYSEMTLGKKLNSVDALKKDDALSRHFNWVARQKSWKE